MLTIINTCFTVVTVGMFKCETVTPTRSANPMIFCSWDATKALI